VASVIVVVHGGSSGGVLLLLNWSCWGQKGTCGRLK